MHLQEVLLKSVTIILLGSLLTCTVALGGGMCRYGRGPFTAMEIEGPLFDRDDEPTAPSVFLSALEGKQPQ